MAWPSVTTKGELYQKQNRPEWLNLKPFFRTITRNMETTFLSTFRSPSSSSITKRNNAMMSKPKTCWVKKLVSKKEKRQIIIIKLFCVPQVIFFFASCESFVYTHVSFFVVEIFFGEEKTSF